MTKEISLVAFADRANSFIFAAVPDQRGRYVRTDKSVVLVDCPMCGSVVGEPCKGRAFGGTVYGGTTHANRRSAVARKFFGADFDDALEQPHAAALVPDEWMEPAA